MGRASRRLRGLGALVVVAGGGLLFLASPASAGPNGGTLYVNASTGHDVGTCRLAAHPCQTIAFALTTATANSTIDVAAGSYPQQLDISQSVTIVGASNGTETINPATLPTSDTDTDSTTPEYAIVDVTGGVTANLEHLTINGAAGQGQFDGCADDYVGVYYHDSSGLMSNDKVTNIDLPAPDFGCQDGQGVYVAADPSTTSSVTMTNDSVTKYDKNGITCDDAGTSCTITGTTVTGDGEISTIAQNGIQLYDPVSATLTNDIVTGNAYIDNANNGFASSGLLICSVGTLTVTGTTAEQNDLNAYICQDGSGPAAGTWSVSHSTFSDGTSQSGYGYGIYLDSTAGTLTFNTDIISHNPGEGFAAGSVSNMTLESSTLNSNGGDGVYIGGPGGSASTASTGNTVSGNTVNKNGGDGIFADTLSSGNQFTSNITKRNQTYDLQDLSGGVNGPVLNTWTGNTCKPANDSSPSGLCG